MTQGPPISPTTPPASPPRNEGEFARRLALGILSTLERKGLLTENDVDTILQAAYRAAQAQTQAEAAAASQPPVPAPTLPRAPLIHSNPMSRPQITATPPAAGPAALGTRWVKSPAAESAPHPESGHLEADEAVRILKPLAQPSPAPSVPQPDLQAAEAQAEATRSGVLVLSEDSEEAAPAPKEAAKPAAPPLPVIDFTLD